MGYIQAHRNLKLVKEFYVKVHQLWKFEDVIGNKLFQEHGYLGSEIVAIS